MHPAPFDSEALRVYASIKKGDDEFRVFNAPKDAKEANYAVGAFGAAYFPTSANNS